MSTPTEKQVANRALWVEALRSGEYRKAVGHLREGPPNSSCCCVWGVACDVVEPGPFALYGGQFCGPPESVEEAMGMRDDEDLWEDDFYASSLMVLNDHKGFSFDELADLIQLHTLDQLGGGVI